MLQPSSCQKVLLIISASLLLSCSENNNPDIFELQACTEQDATIKFIEVTEKPSFSDGKLIKENATQYPEMAQRAGIEGTVWSSFDVTESGIAENIRIEKGIGGGADESALRGIQDAEFIPAKFNGDSKCTKIFAQVIFDLDQIENIVIYLEDELMLK